MSSITGLISGGGGGGGETHIKTDPRQLSRFGVGQLYIKTVASNSRPSNEAIFWNNMALIDRIATVTTSSSNTYATLLNITNAPNGGYIHWIISNGLSPSNTRSTVRITVDGGDPVEIPYQYVSNQFNKSRMFIGGGLAVATHSTSTSANAYQDFWNPYGTVGIANSGDAFQNAVSNFDDNTNHVYGIGEFSGRIVSDFALLLNMPFERLKFESSILIEVKQATYNTTNNHHHAACFYTLQ